MITCEEPPRLIHAETLLETDVPGKRTFAIQVRDDSMQPLFSEGEIIFVNPDLPAEPGQYVVVASEDRRPGRYDYGNVRKLMDDLFFIHSAVGMKTSP